jgi:mono/diheme cytochrome c family protein
VSQKLRMRPLGRGWISRRFGFAGAAFYTSVMFAALSLGHSMASAQSDATDPPQEGREIIAATDSVAAGQRLFGLNCTYCHGAKGIGGRGRPLQCRDDLTASIIFETITNGRDSPGFVMPSWKGSIAEPDRWKLAAYILSLRNLPNCK